MQDFFNEFPSISLEDWKAQIVADLKGKEHEVLEFSDPIEALDFKAYYHGDESEQREEAPGNFPYTRGQYALNNNWNNGAWIIIEEEATANKKALKSLMQGADFLVFKATSDNHDWKKVLNGIECQYIQTQFDVKSQTACETIISIIGHEHLDKVRFNFDPISSGEHHLFKELKTGYTAFVVNGFGVQQAGATTWQEIAFCLNMGHEYLLQLMEAGKTIDEASQMIHFHLGVGSNYFNEIGKFRVMRSLWSNIIAAYHPATAEVFNMHITAIVGHTNKSLRDPYTNLLRQTTEVMSAVNGADALVVLPYDLYSDAGTSELSERMALNISLILQEESYLDKVIDPVGGSYALQHITKQIRSKAWSYFQHLEAQGGLLQTECLEQLKADILEKQEQRIRAFQNGTITHIGINKYPDTREHQGEWVSQDSYLGLPALVLELQNVPTS